MTKADIIEEVANKTGFTKVETEAVFTAIIDSISKALKNSSRVDIRGFGNFSVKQRVAREARNPKTQKIIKLQERYVPIFKVSKLLREEVSKAILRGF
ncbi:MAG: integration host factor subunit beta [Candidatus Marinimicrobia bacterium]|nr:integration host factor subunit beta [Candidatus Neomarinimicrobiota bacterium]MBL7023342.1 integration host factor subunit beta [Candidatus Neomarinimicrobiota bacterium]MBL7109301.1 integration host factor subunit beta [Candidatus Neomarinimicrobiota bacterium]